MTQSRKDALQDLLAKVEAGEAPKYSFMMGVRFPSIWGVLDAAHRHTAFGAYNGSLDAAHDLHEAVLPDTKWQLTFQDGTYDFALVNKGFVQGTCITKNPSRAWLIAIIKALIAEADASPDPLR